MSTALALSGVSGVGMSSASPADGSGQCTFGITPPTVVAVSGVRYVYATLRAGACTMHADITKSTVCLSIEGDDSGGECASKAGKEPAELYIAYRPGATYVEKGEGCANINVAPYTLCENFPASRFTL